MDTGCENCGQKPSLLYFQIKKYRLESWSENKFFPGYFVCILTTSMKNIYINAFLFIDSINEWENLPFIVRTSVPVVQLSFYHNTLPVKGNPDVALTLALPEFSSQFYKARHKHTGFFMQPLCQA